MKGYDIVNYSDLLLLDNSVTKWELLANNDGRYNSFYNRFNAGDTDELFTFTINDKRLFLRFDEPINMSNGVLQLPEHEIRRFLKFSYRYNIQVHYAVGTPYFNADGTQLVKKPDCNGTCYATTSFILMNNTIYYYLDQVRFLELSQELPSITVVFE